MRPWIFAIALVGACTTPANLTPPSGPGTGQPCGVNGVVCLDPSDQPSGMCCSENETCGGGAHSVGCPPGACCFIGTGPRDLSGARRSQAQRPAR